MDTSVLESQQVENRFKKYKETMEKHKDKISGPTINYDSINQQDSNETTTTTTTSNNTNNNTNEETTTSSPQTNRSKQKQTTKEEPREWTNEEQSELEIALRTYPSSMGQERWDKIAESVPTRTKRECVLRYKYLVSIIKKAKEEQ